MEIEKETEATGFPFSFTFKGFLIGVFFAMASYFIQSSVSPGLGPHPSFWLMMQNFHTVNPVLYLMDLSPLIFAIAGALIGKKQQEKQVYANQLKDLLDKQNAQLTSLRFRHAELFEKTDDCLFVTKLNGEVVDMNRAGMKVFKLDILLNSVPESHEELIASLKERGITASSVYVKPEDRQRMIAQLKEKGIVSNYEVKLRRFDGSVFDALITLTRKKDLIFGRAIDLSSVKRAEILLKKANAELEKKNQELLKTFSELQVLRIQDEQRGKELAKLNEELKRANRLLAEMAITDGLTNLYNHRHFMMLLKKEWERAKRNKHNFCVLMIDIDHFKDLNDAWGHQIGDEVLKFVARTLRVQSRDYDIVARYGGEEFSAIFPDTDLTTGYAIAKRMNQAIGRRTLRVGPQKKEAHITVSVGVTIFLADSDDPRACEQVLKDADVALYLAKNKGRDRVEVYRSDMFSEVAKQARGGKPEK